MCRRFRSAYSIVDSTIILTCVWICSALKLLYIARIPSVRNVCVYVRMFLDRPVWLRTVCVCLLASVHMYVCMYMHVYVCTYV